MSTGSRGPKQMTPHGPLQRLLEAMLPIHLAAVTDHRNLYQGFGVVDGVHHSPIPDANSPEVGGALKFLATSWSRLFGQSLDTLKNSSSDATVKRLQLFASRARKDDRVFTHGFCVWQGALAGA